MPRPLVLGWIDPNDLLTLNIAELLAPVETCWNNILVGCPVNALEIAGISMVQRQYPKWCDGAAGTRGLLMVTWFYPTVRKTHTAQITCKCSSNMYIIFFLGGEIPASNSNPSAHTIAIKLSVDFTRLGRFQDCIGTLFGNRHRQPHWEALLQSTSRTWMWCVLANLSNHWWMMNIQYIIQTIRFVIYSYVCSWYAYIHKGCPSTQPPSLFNASGGGTSKKLLMTSCDWHKHTHTHSLIKQMAALSITMEWHALCLFYVMILLWSPSMSESRYITKNLDLLHLHAFNISGKRKKDKQPFNTLSGVGISLNRPFTTSPSHHEPML